MRRYVLPYLWPVVTGVLLAVVILFALPEQLPNPFRDSPPQAPQSPAPVISTVPAAVEPNPNRPAPEIHQQRRPWLTFIHHVLWNAISTH